jgi:hypothetical protein
MTQDDPSKPLGDSFAVAILHWPSVIGALTLEGDGWVLILRGVLATWAALVALGLIFGRPEGPRWGLVMTLTAAFAAAFWMTVPSLWASFWFVAVMIGLHTSIKVRMEETSRAPARPQCAE